MKYCMKKRFIILAAVMCCCAILTGCSGEAFPPDSSGEALPSDSSRALSDNESSNVEKLLQMDYPDKVVALMGSFSEIWMLSGGELYGVTDDAFTEKQLDLNEEIAVVGSFNLPNLEEIIALEPDLVLLSTATEAHRALVEPLEKAGIQTASFNVTFFDDYLDMLSVCTKITGRPDLYEEHGLKVQKQIEKAVQRTNQHLTKKPQPRILLLITYSGGVTVQSSDSMTGKMLKDLGCENLADTMPSLLNEMSMEVVIEQDPDYIFVIPMGNSDELALKNLKESIEDNPAWMGLTAVQEERYILLPKEKFLYKPNHLWGESYEYLAEILLSETVGEQ